MNNVERSSGRLERTDYLVLATPAVWAPARLAAHNITGVPHLERQVGIALLLWGISCLLAWSLIRVGVVRRAAVSVVFVGMFCFLALGPISRELGAIVASILIVAAMLIVGVLIHRGVAEIAFTVAIVALAVGLIAGPAIDLASSMINYGESTVVAEELSELTLTQKPDVWLLVVDGYPGPQSIAAAQRPGGSGSLTMSLGGRGYELVGSAWSSYPATRLSVSSLLDMGYPTTGWNESSATKQDLYDIISGKNNLVAILESNGYETIMIESAWSGSSCRVNYDICIPAPFHDEAVDYMLHKSVLGTLGSALPGSSFKVSALEVMKDLSELARSDETPGSRFVFAHILAPHPPFFFDERCDLDFDSSRRGFYYTVPGVPRAQRDVYFREQLDCVDSFLIEFAGIVSDGAVVVIVGDHGTGRRAQLTRDPDDWSRDDIIERMNVMLAVKTPGNCSVGKKVVLPNLFRKILNCYGNQELVELAPLMFVGPGVEVDWVSVTGAETE